MRTACAQSEADAPPAKPAGGYRVINAAGLAAAWWAYRHKIIRLADLRIWFAAHEMDARRCRVGVAFPRSFHLEELRKLTGLATKRLKKSLLRLRDADLLDWSEHALAFPRSLDDVTFARQDDCRDFLDQIPNPNRKVPVPRRILRILAGGARPALIATVLGHLIRGLYLKSGKCLGRGRVKASWIADVFGVGLRRVKQARQELIASGWIIPLDADQWALNRWGAHFRINLQWSRLDAVTPAYTPARISSGHPVPGETYPGLGAELAPPPAPNRPRLAPPESYEKPLDGIKNQKPAAGGPAGFFKDGVSGKVAHAATVLSRPPAPPAPPLGTPDLHNIVPADLKDTGRLLILLGQAIAQGLVSTSERDRLRFVSAAEHARVIGTRNPCGLFVKLIRGGLWSFLTQDDEDAGNARLKRHLHGSPLKPPEPAPSPPVRVLATLSEDAVLVRAVRGVAAKARYRGEAFPLLKRERPEWTRERWDQALVELERDALTPRSQFSTVGESF